MYSMLNEAFAVNIIVKYNNNNPCVSVAYLDLYFGSSFTEFGLKFGSKFHIT